MSCRINKPEELFTKVIPGFFHSIKWKKPGEKEEN